MSAPGRIAGVCYLAYTTADGAEAQLSLRGSFKIDLDPTEREGVAGLDGVHGYKETHKVPFIEGECTVPPNETPTALQNVRDATVTARLANGVSGVLRNAWTAGSREIDGDEGKMTVRFEGFSGNYYT